MHKTIVPKINCPKFVAREVHSEGRLNNFHLDYYALTILLKIWLVVADGSLDEAGVCIDIGNYVRRFAH
jgi:hypothetical protein